MYYKYFHVWLYSVFIYLFLFSQQGLTYEAGSFLFSTLNLPGNFITIYSLLLYMLFFKIHFFVSWNLECLFFLTVRNTVFNEIFYYNILLVFFSTYSYSYSYFVLTWRYIYLLASIPALLLTILLFMDQQITSVIVNRKEHKLKVNC